MYQREQSPLLSAVKNETVTDGGNYTGAVRVSTGVDTVAKQLPGGNCATIPHVLDIILPNTFGVVDDEEIVIDLRPSMTCVKCGRTFTHPPAFAVHRKSCKGHVVGKPSPRAPTPGGASPAESAAAAASAAAVSAAVAETGAEIPAPPTAERDQSSTAAIASRPCPRCKLRSGVCRRPGDAGHLRADETQSVANELPAEEDRVEMLLQEPLARKPVDPVGLDLKQTLTSKRRRKTKSMDYDDMGKSQLTPEEQIQRKKQLHACLNARLPG